MRPAARRLEGVARERMLPSSLSSSSDWGVGAELGRRCRVRSITPKENTHQTKAGSEVSGSLFLVKPLVLGDARLCVLAVYNMAVGAHILKKEPDGPCSTHREAITCKPRPLIMIRVSGGASHLRGR